VCRCIFNGGVSRLVWIVAVLGKCVWFFYWLFLGGKRWNVGNWWFCWVIFWFVIFGRYFLVMFFLYWCFFGVRDFECRL